MGIRISLSISRANLDYFNTLTFAQIRGGFLPRGELLSLTNNGIKNPERPHHRAKTFLLEFCSRRIKKEVFFETANRVFALYRNQMSGNPVRIGDGCATVTGYKLPRPLIIIGSGRRERGSSPKSGYRFECARQVGRRVDRG
jgi:hypothetical protein